jgi:hypothetical protein
MSEIRKPSSTWIVKENKMARLETPLLTVEIIYFEPNKWTIWNPLFTKDIVEKEFDSFEEAAIMAEDHAITQLENCINLIKK